MGAVANYVTELLDELLGESAVREATFPWALGDVSTKTGGSRRLPFDALWESRKLIIEVDEDQHHKPTPFFDKPDVMTVSGVSRGEQRRIYDDRKRRAARKAGYVVIEIPWERRPPPARRDRKADRERLRAILTEAGVLKQTPALGPLQ